MGIYDPKTFKAVAKKLLITANTPVLSEHHTVMNTPFALK